MSILQTIDLKKYYGTEPNITRALDGVNFSVDLPLPEVPTTATNSPSSTEKFTPSRARVMFGSVP